MKTVPCKYCTDPTPMTATELCSRCWELETRITAFPELAAVILTAVVGRIPRLSPLGLDLMRLLAGWLGRVCGNPGGCPNPIHNTARTVIRETEVRL